MTQAYPLASDTWDQAEYDAAQAVLKSGRFTMGERVKAFEADFAKLFGSKYAVMVNSGSSANLVTIAAAFYMPDSPLKAGDEVLVPAVSWSTTYYPIHQLGLTLSFVDIDPLTLNLDLAKLEASITPRTKAVFAVNLLGNPNHFDALRAICAKHNLLLLEDNCESMGATFGGKQAGTFGLAGTFSTFYSHHIATMEGGVVVTDDKNFYHALVSLRAHGWTRDQPEDSPFYLNEDPFINLFRFVLPGYNLRPLEIEAAVGVEQLKKLPGFIVERRKNARIFMDAFADYPWARLQREIGESSWFGFSLVLQGKLQGRRKEVVAMLRKAGVECRPIVTGNFLRNPVIKHLNHVVRQEITAADEIDRDGLFIGNHHYSLADRIAFVRGLFEGLEKAL
jgi:CDP-6-deoxy-D-xylo-4-hexulose-3-dehydrase